MERHGMTKRLLGAAMAMGAAVALADDDAPGRPHGPPPRRPWRLAAASRKVPHAASRWAATRSRAPAEPGQADRARSPARRRVHRITDPPTLEPW
jgi:hypothetical protein